MKKFKLKIFNKKLSPSFWKRGMTYVELIVVLSIFSLISSVVLFNYGFFQSKVDIKNLASDVALQITQAQKDAISGKVDSQASASWKPAYGVQFDTTADNKRFVYFSDRNSDGTLTGTVCTGECISNVAITKGNYISALGVVGSGTCSTSLTKIEITYTRPDSSARITTTPSSSACTISYAQITLTSPKSPTSVIKVYSSGRIQLN